MFIVNDSFTYQMIVLLGIDTKTFLKNIFNNINLMINDVYDRVREMGRPNYNNFWIVFDEDTFGFHSDQSTADFLRIYHRVKDALLQ